MNKYIVYCFLFLGLIFLTSCESNESIPQLTENEKYLVSSTNDYYANINFPRKWTSVDLILERYSKDNLLSSTKITSFNNTKDLKYLLITGNKIEDSKYLFKATCLRNNTTSVAFNIPLSFKNSSVWSSATSKENAEILNNEMVVGIFSFTNQNKIPDYNYDFDETKLAQYMSQMDETYVIKCIFTN